MLAPFFHNVSRGHWDESHAIAVLSSRVLPAACKTSQKGEQRDGEDIDRAGNGGQVRSMGRGKRESSRVGLWAGRERESTKSEEAGAQEKFG